MYSKKITFGEGVPFCYFRSFSLRTLRVKTCYFFLLALSLLLQQLTYSLPLLWRDFEVSGVGSANDQ